MPILEKHINKLYDINIEKILNRVAFNSDNFAKIVILRLNYKQY
jgi:hypothetical protein